jgi:hypothetical protein
MNFRKLTWLAIFLAALWLTACQPPRTVSTPTVKPELVLTAAAQTASVRLTQIVQLTPSVTPTPLTPTPNMTQTAISSTAIAELTGTASAVSPTPRPATPTPTTQFSNAADLALFDSDVTVKDGSIFAANTAFKKTWRIKNAGTSTWTTAYALVFVQGDKMDGPDMVKLTQAVKPGELVDITVNLVAPSTPRTYRGYWRMINANGKFFNDSVYVEIVVPGGTITPVTTSTSGTPAATATTSSGLTVSGLTMEVDNNAYNSTCPHTLTFTAKFNASIAGVVSYRLEAASSTPGFVFSLPAPANVSVAVGQNSLQFFLEMTDSTSGWVAFHITSPADVTSNQASFTLTCTP